MHPKETLSSTLPFALTRPVHVARVGLLAKNVPALAGYYQALLGLEPASIAGGTSLAAGGVTLLEIGAAPKGAGLDDPRSGGLFHTAFLMPSRADLGRWVRLAAERGIQFDGMADHLVSEAIYLTDPEGNGIEVYADRDPSAWSWNGGLVQMANRPLDIPAIAASAGADAAPYTSAPEALRIGHVHLRVGDTEAAEQWWVSEVGLNPTARLRGACFLSSGAYHHHIAVNSWQSLGAGPRDPNRTGLAHVTLASTEAQTEREIVDPWGTIVRIEPAYLRSE
jgi:catechol 2,3-dioxygenase